MYKETVHIRFSETDESGRLSPGGLLRLFQDLGYSHAYLRGQTPSNGGDINATWYLLKWHIERYKMPVCHEEVELSTWIYKQGASMAHKQILMRDKSGEILALGDTTWVYVDTQSGKPALPRQGIWLPEDHGERLPGARAVRRIKQIDCDDPEVIALPHEAVDFRLIDINHHANNVLFTEYALMLCGGCRDCRYIGAEFLIQAKAGEELYPYLSECDGGRTVAVCNAEKKPFAIFRFE